MGKLTLEQNEIRNTMQFERQLISMSPLLYWEPACQLSCYFQAPSLSLYWGWRIGGACCAFKIHLSSYLPQRARRALFCKGKTATPYVNELIVFSTSLQEEGSLKITDLSSGRFLKMLKRYPQFQGYHLLWFLVKFTRSESAGAWRSQLGRRHRGWVGGGKSGNVNRTSRYTAQETEPWLPVTRALSSWSWFIFSIYFHGSNNGPLAKIHSTGCSVITEGQMYGDWISIPLWGHFHMVASTE